MNRNTILVTISFGSYEEAETICKGLVSQKLAACAQLFPIRSFFTWEKEAKAEDEYSVHLKTTEANLEAIEAFVLEHHSYEVPEIIATPVIWGHKPYMDWLQTNTTR